MGADLHDNQTPSSGLAIGKAWSFEQSMHSNYSRMYVSIKKLKLHWSKKKEPKRHIMICTWASKLYISL